MKKNIIYGILAIFFFIVYFKILGFIWLWVPRNPFTDVLSMFIVLIILVPLSAISAHKLFATIKKC